MEAKKIAGLIQSSKNILTIFLFFLIIINFYSCEAPRSNPLDPHSSNSKFAVIEGKVETLSVPFTGIPEVSVIWNNANKMVKTDANGNFTINDIQPVDGKLIFQKEGYVTDTLEILWNGNIRVNEQINLNKIPMLDSISIKSIVLNNTQERKNFELSIITKISDKDNDIDSAYLFNPVLNFSAGLDFNAQERLFEANLTLTQMNITSLESAIGTDFNIYVLDIFRNEFQIGSGKISRIINNKPEIISPTENTIADSLTLFQWLQFDAGYSFTYTLEVYTNEPANPQQLLKVENIPPDAVSYQLTTSLSPEEYYWVLWVVDKFRNKARSIPSFFIVQ